MTEAIEETIQTLGPGHVRRLCQAAGLSRATYYRLRSAGPARDEEETHLRGLIQEIVLKWPSYGYRRITAELYQLGVRAEPGGKPDDNCALVGPFEPHGRTRTNSSLRPRRCSMPVRITSICSTHTTFGSR